MLFGSRSFRRSLSLAFPSNDWHAFSFPRLLSHCQFSTVCPANDCMSLRREIVQCAPKKENLYNDSKLQFLHLAALNYGKIFRTTSWIDYHIIIIAYQELVLIPTRSTFPIIKHSFFLLRARFVRSLCRVAMYLCARNVHARHRRWNNK